MIKIVMTPEVRQLALTHLRFAELDPELDRDELVCWFSTHDTPDGVELDASRSDSDAAMIHVVATALLYRHWRESYEPDTDAAIREAEEAVRTLSRY